MGKAALLAAAARAEGIPARLRFADVRNHLCTPRLRALIGGDVFYCHGYVELALGRSVGEGHAGLRPRALRPLRRTGARVRWPQDSIFQPYDRTGRRHMEYLRDRGVQADVPVADIAAAFAREYPRLVERSASAVVTRFREEAGDTHAE